MYCQQFENINLGHNNDNNDIFLKDTIVMDFFFMNDFIEENC